MLSVHEAADQLGVSPMRVRQLLAQGALAGHKSGRIWLVEPSSVARRGHHHRRPLGERMLRAVITSLSSQDYESASDLSPAEAWRLRKYLHSLTSDPQPAQLLRDWVGSHEQMRALRYVGDVHDLRDDDRLIVTGFSHPLSGLVADGQLDVRCARSDAPTVVADHLLIEDFEPNVYLHHSRMSRPVAGFGIVVVDLAAHAQARADQAVRRLLRRVHGA